VYKHISDAEIADIISKWLAQAPVRIERAKYVFTKCSVCIYLHVYLISYIYFYVIFMYIFMYIPYIVFLQTLNKRNWRNRKRTFRKEEETTRPLNYY